MPFLPRSFALTKVNTNTLLRFSLLNIRFGIYNIEYAIIMDFYTLDISAPCRSVMLVAKAVGVELNKKTMDVTKGEQMNPAFVKLNFQHVIPTLVDGDFVLWESRAICTYLASKFGEDDSLYPKEPKKRAIVDRLLYFDMGVLYHRFGLYVYPVLFEGVPKPDPTKLEKLQEALGFLELHLSDFKFAAANHITVADYALVANVSTFVESGIDISKYEKINKWFQRCKDEMPGYNSENAEGARAFGDMVKQKFNV